MMARRQEDIGTATILAAARRRFLQWGYSGTSTSALAVDLGMTKAALYYHFPDKEALFLAVVDDYLGEVAAELRQAAFLFDSDDRDGALMALAGVFLSRNAANAQMQHISFQESRHLTPEGQESLGQKYHAALVRPLSDLLARASGRGWLRATAQDEPQAIWIFLGLLSAFLHPGHQGPAAVVQSAPAFIRLLLGAIGPVKESV
jgi:AcrR family transcriptional regulator